MAITKRHAFQAFAHSVVTVNNNRRNLGSQESVGVKFKEGICAEFCLKLWFENDLYFCNITLSQDGFESDCSEKKVLNNDFLKSLQKQPYADVLQNRCL